MQKVKTLKQNQRAFTLIELIVVMAVFLFVIGAAMGIFISMVQNQKKVLAEQQFLSQISYAEEYMSKALRMASIAEDDSCIPQGYIYLLTHYNTVSGFFDGIKFINASDGDACQEFFLDTDGVLKEVKYPSASVALTSSGLKINFVRFAINGSNGSTFPSGTNLGSASCDSTTQCGASDKDSVQPRVTMLLNVSIGIESARTIQTTVSQRSLNINNGQR